jgi:hypothetical protein
MEFKDVLKGQTFLYNGNLYKKVSSRTAIFVRLNKIFYFSMDDYCRNVSVI